MAEFDARAAILTESLQKEAGINPRQDAYHSGYIQAVRDLLLVQLDDIKET